MDSQPQSRQDPSGSFKGQRRVWLSSRKWDIISLVLGLATFGALIGLLVYVDGSSISRKRIAIIKTVIVALVFILYVFLLFPASNSLRRIKRLHTGSLSLDAIDARYRRPIEALLSALKAFFTFRLFGIASAPVLAILVAAILIPIPWTNAIIMRRSWSTSQVPNNGWAETPTVTIARDINPNRYEQISKRSHESALLSALNRGLGGDPYWNYEPFYYCPDRMEGFSSCTWNDFATIAIRSQCKDADEHLELARSYPTRKAFRDVSSLPPYNPLDESRAESSSPWIMSFKNTTFITLSNLRSHTGPWTSGKDCMHDDSKTGCSITEEALGRMERFSSLVINPVSTNKKHDLEFNQTAGTLFNFQVIYAELGLSGHYSAGKLQYLDLVKETAKAWECSLDTVVESKNARFTSGRFSEYSQTWNGRSVVLPSNDLRVSDKCGKRVSSCQSSFNNTIDFLRNNEVYSVDRRVTSSMAEHLETFFAGSSFADGWQSKDNLGVQKLNSTSTTSTLIHNQIASTLASWRLDGRWSSPFWRNSATGVFDSVAASLTQYLRHYNGYCGGRWGCGNEYAEGEIYVMSDHYMIDGAFLWYPGALVGCTILLVVLAIVDEHYNRIRLPDNDGEDEGGNAAEDDGVSMHATHAEERADETDADTDEQLRTEE